MQKLRVIRRRLGISQRACAVRAGLAAQQWLNLETGASEPMNLRLSTVLALLETYPELRLVDFGYRGALSLGRS